MVDELNEYDGSEWVKFTTKSWKVYRPDKRDSDEKQHPAKFPQELAKDYIRFFTKSGDLVLDPFAGVGTTVQAADSCNRTGIGVELNDEYAEIGREKIHGGGESRIISTDIRTFVDGSGDDTEADFVFTSPPYWNVLNKSRGGADTAQKQREREGLDTSYSSSTADLGNIEDYDVFIDELASIFRDMSVLLSDGAYIAIVSQNVRDEDGVVRPICYDIALELSDTYTLKGERLWLQDDKPSAIWGYPTEYVSGKAHHIINIFKHTE